MLERERGAWMLERERERVAAGARRLAAEGLVIGTAGNISERAGDRVAITPTGGVFEELEADQVAVLDLAGEQLDGQLQPSSELGLHLGIYERYDAGAVVHTHPPIGTALSCVLDELPVIHYQMLLLGGPVRVAPYATFGSQELAELTLEALDGRAGALMSNHGAITHGADLDGAISQSLLLEWACELYWRARSIGQPRSLDQQQVQSVAEAALARGYGSTRRIGDQ